MSRLTPAQKHLLKVQAAKDAVVAAATGQAPPPPKVPAADIATDVDPARLSPAQRQVLKHHAVAAAAAAAAGETANDNLSGNAPVVTVYEKMLGQLAEDRRALKSIQSIAKKIELKAQLLGRYLPYVDDVLAASKAVGAAAQDQVVVYMLIWCADVAHWTGFLAIAEHCLRYRLQLPEQHNRTLATFVAEEPADAAIKAFAAGGVFPADLLEQVEILVDGEDMPDQVRAKLHKALGQEAIRRAEASADDQAVAGMPRAAWQAAQDHLRRALELNDKVGVKKDLERVDRELKKSEEPGGQST